MIIQRLYKSILLGNEIHAGLQKNETFQGGGGVICSKKANIKGVKLGIDFMCFMMKFFFTVLLMKQNILDLELKATL